MDLAIGVAPQYLTDELPDEPFSPKPSLVSSWYGEYGLGQPLPWPR